MTTYFITRHAGATEWLVRQGLQVDRILEHLDPTLVQPGDIIIGTLPVHLAGGVCSRGARYFNLSVNLPPQARGKELSAAELECFGARLEEYYVAKIK